MLLGFILRDKESRFLFLAQAESQKVGKEAVKAFSITVCVLAEVLQFRLVSKAPSPLVDVLWGQGALLTRRS